MKGRTWGDGQKQRKKVVIGDATSSTVSMEYVLIPATVNAHAERNARICDIPGDFLSADIDEDVKMALRGRLAELLVKIVPKIYIHHVI